MATDRTTYHEQACPCGAGQFRVVWAAPEHPGSRYPGHWELYVRCDICRPDWILMLRGKEILAVRRVEFDAEGEPHEGAGQVVYEVGWTGARTDATSS